MWFCVCEWARRALDTVPFQRANLLRSFLTPGTSGNGSSTGAAGAKTAPVTTVVRSRNQFGQEQKPVCSRFPAGAEAYEKR